MIDIETLNELLTGYSQAFPRCNLNFQNNMVLTLWHKALKDLEADQLVFVLGHYLQFENYFPSLSQIINKINPKLDIETRAKEITGRVIESLGRFGSYHPKEAREYIGEVGWKAVQASCTDWYTATEIPNDKLSFFETKVDGHVKSFLKIEEAGLDLNRNLNIEQKEGNPFLQNALNVAISKPIPVSI